MGERFNTAQMQGVVRNADKFNKIQECFDATTIGSDLFLRLSDGTSNVKASVTIPLTEAGVAALQAFLAVYSKPLRDTIVASGLTPEAT